MIVKIHEHLLDHIFKRSVVLFFSGNFLILLLLLLVDWIKLTLNLFKLFWIVGRWRVSIRQCLLSLCWGYGASYRRRRAWRWRASRRRRRWGREKRTRRRTRPRRELIVHDCINRLIIIHRWWLRQFLMRMNQMNNVRGYVRVL